jgi:hypothetical protein
MQLWEMRMRRQDTKFEAEDAELLVLSRPLFHRIEAYKAYTNMPGYDLVARNPPILGRRTARPKSSLTP